MKGKKQWIAVLLAIVLVFQGASMFSARAEGTDSGMQEGTEVPSTTTAPEGPDSTTTKSPEEERLYTVTYTDGLGGVVFADITEDLFYGSETPTDPSLINMVPQRAGWVFDGWSPERAEIVTESVVYTAIWKEDANGNGLADEYESLTFTITYTDGVDGMVVFNDVVIPDVSYGSEIPSYPNGEPQREGYIFDGWSPAVQGTVLSDLTFTAQWIEKIEIEISQLHVKDVTCYFDVTEESMRFEPQELSVETNRGTFTSYSGGEGLLQELRNYTGDWSMTAEFGVLNREELTWEEGSQKVQYFFGDQTAEYTVTVLPALLSNVQAEDLHFYADGSSQNLYSSDYAPKNVTVTLGDGSVLKGTPEDLRMQIWDKVQFMPDYGFDADPGALLLEAGSQYEIAWHFGSFHLTYTVYIEDIADYPIASLAVDDLYTFAEYLPIEKYLPFYDTPNRITVTMRDGESFSGTPEEVSNKLAAAYGMVLSYRLKTSNFPYDVMKREDAVGDYVNTYSFGILEAEFTIHVCFLIEKLEHVQLRFIVSEEEGTMHPADFFTGTNYMICPPQVKVELFDGSVYEGFPEEVQRSIFDKYITMENGTVMLRLWGDSVSPDETWEYGTYEHPFEYMRHYATLKIYVEAPENIDVDTQMGYLTAAGADEDTPCDVTVDRRTNATDLLALLQAREKEGQ